MNSNNGKRTRLFMRAFKESWQPRPIRSIRPNNAVIKISSDKYHKVFWLPRREYRSLGKQPTYTYTNTLLVYFNMTGKRCGSHKKEREKERKKGRKNSDSHSHGGGGGCSRAAQLEGPCPNRFCIRRAGHNGAGADHPERVTSFSGLYHVIWCVRVKAGGLAGLCASPGEAFVFLGRRHHRSDMARTTRSKRAHQAGRRCSKAESS